LIAIVGGGISGLALARELDRREVDFVLLEAERRVGGVIRSGRVEGHLLDWGPQRARLTRPLAELVDEIGLSDQLVTAPTGLDLFVYRSGRLRRVPFGVAAFLTSDVVGPLAKLRAALEPLTAGPDPDESVARYFTRKLGRDVYETLAGPLYGGLYGSDPADMRVGLSLQHALAELGVGRSLVMRLLRGGGKVRPPPACSFREGMQALPSALAHRLGERVRMEVSALALHRRAEGGGAGGWLVETTDGGVEADHVVLAVPGGVAARRLDPIAPDAARRIAGLRYNPLGVVHLHAHTRLHGMGFQVSFAESLALRGVTYNDSLFGRTGVYTAYLGGGARPEVVELDDDALSRLAVDEFRACTGYDSRPLAVAREAMPAWDLTWSSLAGLTLPTGIHVTANWESRPGLPGRFARARTLAEALARLRSEDR
jgi:oxygen-dependent protoporphyrinogen oxidase